MIFPKTLKPGDEVRIVSPSGAVDEKFVNMAAQVMESWGLKVTLAPNATNKYHRFAAPDSERYKDLQIALSDPNVKAIVCGRGGYGLTRIVDQLDFTKFVQYPKFVVGFSDITALHSAIFTKTKGISIHGAMCKSFACTLNPDFMELSSAEVADSVKSVEALRDLLMNTPQVYAYESKHHHNRMVMKSVTGRLFGGNLTLLSALRGTNIDVLRYSGILYIEDVGERLYSIDRMLQSMRLAGVFSRIKGLVVGEFTDTDVDSSFGTIDELIRNATKDYSFPILFGIPFGHGSLNMPIVNGASATITDNVLKVKLKP